MYFKQLDSLRFFAVSLVLIAHWAHGLPYVERLRFSSIGVDLFFVISGFLISLQLYDFKSALENQRVTFGKTLKVFYVRRILRIFPLYYFIIFVSSVFNTGEIRDALLWNIAYLSNFYFIKMNHWASTFSHFWSLSVEEHFYLVWPFVVLLTNRKNLPYVFIGVSLLAVLFRYISFSQTHDLFVVNIHTVSCLDLFMIGGALAYIYEYQHDRFVTIFSKCYLSIRGVRLLSNFILCVSCSIRSGKLQLGFSTITAGYYLRVSHWFLSNRIKRARWPVLRK
jgi:peptidoglycan/LPS O-acetylase OafA/YrhL